MIPAISPGPRELPSVRASCPSNRRRIQGNERCRQLLWWRHLAIYHYDLSMKILSKKIKSIEETGADTVATFCPTCIMQLRHGLAKQNLAIEVAHPVQLLAQSLKTGLNTKNPTI